MKVRVFMHPEGNLMGLFEEQEHQEGFDATEVEPAGEFTPVPMGTYVSMIVDSALKDCGENSNDPDGQHLDLELDILEGDYKGRKFWDLLNLVNKNPTAVEIAQRMLSAICTATGKMKIADSEELHDIPMNVKLKVKPAKKDNDGNILFAAKNEVVSYKPLNSAQVSTTDETDGDGDEAETKKPARKPRSDKPKASGGGASKKAWER